MADTVIVNQPAATEPSKVDVTITPPPKSWHRLALSLLGISIIASMWVGAVAYIFRLPPDKLAAFTSVTTNSLYTIAAIVIFMVTGRLVYEWQNTTSAVTTVVSEAKSLIEKKEIIERRVDPKDIPGADGVV